MLKKSGWGVFKHPLILLNRQFCFVVAASLLSAATPALAVETPRSQALGEPQSESIPAASGVLAEVEAEPLTTTALVESSPVAEFAPTSPIMEAVAPLPNTPIAEPALVSQVIAEASAEPSAEAVFTMRFSDLEAALDTDAVVQPETGDDLAQVTRVTDFSDVSPSDWAFQALSNLVETYGCIQGYPDSTFRGQRSITRYEFAAGLNACLDVVVSTLGTGISEEDLATIRRLQEEFAAELATLGGRVDQLEAETAQLRAQQFSTVTKLRGQAFFNMGGGFSNGTVLAETGTRVGGVPATRSIPGNPAVNVGSYLWMNFDTSFSGADRLKLQLVTGSGTGPGNFWTSAGLFNTFGTPIQFQTGVPAGNAYSVYLRELSYAFPIGSSVTVDIGPRINWYSYFDNNRYTFFLTGANSFNSSGGTQVNAVDRGAGAIAVWNVTDWLDVRVGYLAEDTEFIGGPKAPTDPSVGLFGGTSTLTGQIGLRPFNNFNLRLLYTRSNLMPDALGRIGGTFGEPIYGLADDGAGGRLNNAPADTFLVNFDWTPLTWLGLFGRYSYGSVGLTSATTQAGIGSIDAQSLQFGMAFPNLFKEGAQATISYLVPFSVINGRQFLVSGGGDGGRQQEVELVYRYPVNRNIALMPSVYWIMNPNNFSTNPDIFIFNMQAQLTF
ncbi:iron uptake porin [Leptolyngbya sp. CCNP1308]|uniref:iron uptake porin n=1 Tax=Leptolyngbya sp. CCNP1308 TaxID=3110255 RepID=UPI002B1FB781|nr:iron uptake porin [Leptolyngbya sp. CCNP1308]MEA5449618.1 iron uptake porin [Leptolyngbya sp. CCNP1308]